VVRFPVEAPLPNLFEMRRRGLSYARAHGESIREGPFVSYANFMQQYEELEHMTRVEHADQVTRVLFITSRRKGIQQHDKAV